MDKWKIVAIAALLMGLAGYGYYQSTASAPPPFDAKQNAAATSSADKAINKLVGATAPGWKIPAGLWANTPRPLTLSNLKGHITLIEFWRMKCPHCEEAAPFMRAIYGKYHPHGLEMVAFQSPAMTTDPENPENDWNAVRGTVREWKLPYPVAFDKGSVIFRQRYNGQLYPTVLVLDRQGIVRFAQTGHDMGKEKTLENFLAKVFGQHTEQAVKISAQARRKKQQGKRKS